MKLIPHRALLIASLSLLGLGASLSAHADTLDVHATLNAASEVPPKQSDGHGTLTGSYDTSTKVLSWHVVYSGLTGPATMAHFHGPAPVGQNAGVMIPIDMKDVPSPIDGHATLSATQEAGLLAGNWYFNVHTAKNPGGEIRGQVAADKQ
ncbi:CHRD domain-containing protein [Burkholderia gladioli]|uniref:CHRD domain-containing protein n=1 Tax=Burkholderia gladioli TaxID=28095 RepID=UPI001640D294|nr:CHRD domain-containing protein [Burkholderia gladioli]